MLGNVRFSRQALADAACSVVLADVWRELWQFFTSLPRARRVRSAAGEESAGMKTAVFTAAAGVGHGDLAPPAARSDVPCRCEFLRAADARGHLRAGVARPWWMVHD
ncbi:hypothetical protein BE08_06975 [Sorangium cellulosum]|uniref:Uncharacterized protein n=1 Tax=Sorangium cellulosum TaxID=56 RepID=A0A150PIN3_SORCE|nr:hypothetical protein BE08_06975 [Sorangium cellulosum]